MRVGWRPANERFRRVREGVPAVSVPGVSFLQAPPWFGARTRSVLIAEPLPLLLLFAESTAGAGGREPGLGRLRRPPARPAQRHLRLRAQAACLPDVVRQRDVLVERDADGMERGQLRREPVPHALALGLPRAEDPVPDDQDPA